MKILVTGGAGFIGSHIVDAYLGEGHDVVVVDNLSTGREANINNQATFHKADIRDADVVKRIFQAEKPDILCHQAAQIDVRRSVSDPEYDASVNILGFLTLAQSCLQTGVSRIVFASSGGAIYGEQDFFPADESHPTRPISPYGVAKLVTEQYLYYYYAVHGLKSVSLRYANVYGPRQNPEGEAGVVALFASRMLKGGQPLINGDGMQTRDYVFVGDVVRANVLALDQDEWIIYNVGTGKETDVNELYHHIRSLSGSNCEEKHGEAKLGEQLRSVLSYGKIERQLGWRPEVSIQEGLGRTVDYFRSVL
jgi:UDP-glucose 4-epimerase